MGYAAFSPDGKRIVTTAFNRRAHIWDAETGKQVAVLLGHGGTLTSASFSADGTRVVTSGAYTVTQWRDDTARIWDAATGKEIAALRHEGSVWSAALSPDGKRLVTSDDQAVRIWDVSIATMSSEKLLAEVCLGRRLHGLSTLSRDEMRLAGYPDSVPEIDVCKE